MDAGSFGWQLSQVLEEGTARDERYWCTLQGTGRDKTRLSAEPEASCPFDR